jgi:hypothetical protein
MRQYDLELLVTDGDDKLRGVILYDTLCPEDGEDPVWRYADLDAANKLIAEKKVNLHNEALDSLSDGTVTPDDEETRELIEKDALVDTILGAEDARMSVGIKNIEAMREDTNIAVATFRQTHGGTIYGVVLSCGDGLAKIRRSLRRIERGKSNLAAISITGDGFNAFYACGLEHGFSRTDGFRWEDMASLCEEIRKTGANLVVDRAIEIREHSFAKQYNKQTP